MDSNGVEFRNQLYASIHDRVNAAIEAKKQEIAGNLIRQESSGISLPSVKVKKEFDGEHESEHGVYEGRKKIGYIVHDKKSGKHIAYHGHKYGKDDYAESTVHDSHKDALDQVKDSADIWESNNEEKGENVEKNEERPKKQNAFTMKSKGPSEFAKSSSGGKTKETKTGRIHSSGDRY